MLTCRIRIYVANRALWIVLHSPVCRAFGLTLDQGRLRVRVI
jgi:hypothetical protein